MLENFYKDIYGYEGLYKIDKFSNIYSNYTLKILKQSIHKCGYMNIELRKNGIGKREYVHRLMAKTFLIGEKKEVNHKNGIKSDNRLCNLEWVTSSENKKHAEILGLANHSNKQKNSVYMASRRSNFCNSKAIKISEDEASEICEAYGTGLYSFYEIAVYLNVNRSTIFKIIKGYKNGTL